MQESELIQRNVIKSLVDSYKEKELKIIEVSEAYNLMSKEGLNYVSGDSIISLYEYCSKSNKLIPRNSSISELFNKERMINQLKKEFWGKTFKEARVRSLIPNARLKEWDEMLNTGELLPDYNEETLRDTLFDFINNSRRYLAEKVDGVLKNLSKEHKTNIHDQITERFIFSDLYGSIDDSVYGYLKDLRSVIDQLKNGLNYQESSNTKKMLDYIQQNFVGEWVYVDGNSLRIRVYKKGTVHVELNSELVEEMCVLLSEIYPEQISNKTKIHKSRQKFKNYNLISKTLDQDIFNVLNSGCSTMIDQLNIGTMEDKKRFKELRNTYKHNIKFYNYEIERKISKELSIKLDELMFSIGGKKLTCLGYIWYGFDYNPKVVIEHILYRGYIDDHKSYQYYPTQEDLSKLVIDMADFKSGNEKTLEPSAGQGGLADKIPSKDILCVDISTINAEILKSKGYDVLNEDFLKLSIKGEFERIIMNPPFSDGRCIKHIEKAYEYLSSNGVLVSVIPASLKGKLDKISSHVQYSQVYTDQFENTKVNVVLVKIKKD